jgi:hypothetical protein
MNTNSVEFDRNHIDSTIETVLESRRNEMRGGSEKPIGPSSNSYHTFAGTARGTMDLPNSGERTVEHNLNEETKEQAAVSLNDEMRDTPLYIPALIDLDHQELQRSCKNWTRRLKKRNAWNNKQKSMKSAWCVQQRRRNMQISYENLKESSREL